MRYLVLCILLVGLINSNLLLQAGVHQQAITRPAATVKAAGVRQLMQTQEALPSGSYQKTCSGCNIWLDPKTQQNFLECISCATQTSTRGAMTMLKIDLDLKNKGFDIANCWGVLKYFAPGQGCDNFIPKGTYSQTCKDCFIIAVDPLDIMNTSHVLHCSCRNMAGQDVQTQLIFTGGEVLSNCNGQLKVGNC